MIKRLIMRYIRIRELSNPFVDVLHFTIFERNPMRTTIRLNQMKEQHVSRSAIVGHRTEAPPMSDAVPRSLKRFITFR